MIMTKKELKKFKKNMLKTMHTIVTEDVADENLQERWLMMCVPDCPSEDDFNFIAEDEELWKECCKVFGDIMMAEGRVVF